MPDNIDLPLDRAHPDDSAAISRKEASIDSSLDMLFRSLSVKLGEYVGHRYDKELEWISAERQYNGLIDEYDDKALQALGGTSGSRPPTVNITRPKTNIAIARLQDIQFPLGGEMNFSVDSTPDPELTELLSANVPLTGTEGSPTVSQAANVTLQRAKEKAQRMEAKIHDRFIETTYAKKCRRAMENMGILGTAILKAPVLSYQKKKTYTPIKSLDGSSVQDLSYDFNIVPTIQWVDPRLFFPDPSARPGTSVMDSFEVHMKTHKELIDLSHNPAFMENRIRDVLKQDPTAGVIAKSSLLSIVDNRYTNLETRYHVIEYHGDIDKDVLVDLDLISEKERDDPLVMVQGEVWFANDQIIRVSLSPLEGEEEIPYFLCTWEDDPSSVFGHGVPYLMRDASRVVNSSWRMLLDNAGLTAGPQIVINKEMIQPANASEGWSIRPMKVWFMTEYGGNVKEAMQFVDVPTQQEAISQITELAMQFADLESSIPQIMQGEIPSGNNTFGGLAMVLSASNIIQQRVSERWDDCMTVPIVGKFYHYEMQYGVDDGIKGDYDVKAGGATERIDKQVKAQDLERILGMAGSNEQFLEHIDLGEAFREWVATTRSGDILKPMQQVLMERQQAQEAAATAPPPPDQIEAEAKMKQADATIAQIEMTKQHKQQEYDLRAQVEEAKVDKENRGILARENEAQIQLQIAQMAHEDLLIKIAAERQTSVEKLSQDLNIAVMADETKRLLKQADLDKFNVEIEVKKQLGEGI